jgi:hypothetical protein
VKENRPSQRIARLAFIQTKIDPPPEFRALNPFQREQCSFPARGRRGGAGSPHRQERAAPPQEEIQSAPLNPPLGIPKPHFPCGP